MIREDKELLLKYLCMALPYKIVIDYSYNAFKMHKGSYRSYTKQGSKCLLDCDLLDVFMSPRQNEKGEYIKPYLRPLATITEEERLEISTLIKQDILSPYGKINLQGMDNLLHSVIISSSSLINWLLEKHFDFFNLIPKGLAIDITKENNPYKQYIVITQNILDYIEKNSHNFENPMPILGEKWIVEGEFTYSGVCGGQPVIEIRKTTGEFMRLPKSIIKIE